MLGEAAAVGAGAIEALRARHGRPAEELLPIGRSQTLIGAVTTYEYEHETCVYVTAKHKESINK